MWFYLAVAIVVGGCTILHKVAKLMEDEDHRDTR